MNLHCHITAVEDCGDVLRVRLLGRGPRPAGWRPLSPQMVEIANSDGAGRTFYVGRPVTMTIKPR